MQARVTHWSTSDGQHDKYRLAATSSIALAELIQETFSLSYWSSSWSAEIKWGWREEEEEDEEEDEEEEWEEEEEDEEEEWEEEAEEDEEEEEDKEKKVEEEEVEDDEELSIDIDSRFDP